VRIDDPRLATAATKVADLLGLRADPDYREEFQDCLWMIIDATKHHRLLPRVCGSDVARKMQNIIDDAERLDHAIEQLRHTPMYAYDGPKDERECPFDPSIIMAVELTMLEQPLREASGLNLLEYQRHLRTLREAAKIAGDRAKSIFPSKRGRPKGAGGNPEFDRFVWHLYNILAAFDARLVHHKDRISGEWKGTLLPIMEILRPLLTADGTLPFFPDADLGNVLGRLHTDCRRRLRSQIMAPKK
jgi:hypothetical protein